MYTGRVYVPSIGRASLTNGTISYLKMAMDPKQIVVVTNLDQLEAYARLGVSVICLDKPGLPYALQTIKEIMVNSLKKDAASASRFSYVLDDMPKEHLKFIIMDDDLRFAARGPDNKLHQITASEMIQMLFWIDEQLDHYAHVGISARQGNNNVEMPYKRVTSMRSVLAYNTMSIADESIRFDRTVSKNDYDVTLQLLERGYPNIVSYQYTHDQIGGPTLPGGTTEYRNKEMHLQASRELKAFHPKYVDMVYKEKADWKNTGGGRWDVRIQWLKALGEPK